MNSAGELFPWLTESWRTLLAYVHNDRIPHALLITGHSGAGTTHIAEAFAKLLLCKKKGVDYACGQCSSCKLFLARTHPDFSLVEPEEPGKEIAIDSIRALGGVLSLTPQYGGFRIVQINSAHRLNRAAANSLLKTLEEPLDRTVLMLVTDSPSALPATVVSRCQRIAIPMPRKNLALPWLHRQKSHEHWDVLLALAWGAPLQALDLAQSDYLAQRVRAFELWLKLCRNEIDPVIVAESWSEYSSDQALCWLTSWVIDLIRLCHHPEHAFIFNPDQRMNLQVIAGQLNLRRLFYYLDALFRAKGLLEGQVNRQLLLEDLLIKWSHFLKAQDK